ncbi:MAG: NUDIX domain-containing protein [Thiohalomonadales bacterium]
MKYCPNCRSALSLKTIDEHQRSVCLLESCGYIHWNNPTSVVLALVQIDNRFILARPHYEPNTKWPSEIYSLISGFVESNETLEQAAIREVKEELGLDSKIVSYIGSYPFEKMNQIVVAYWLSATGEIKLNNEIAELKFVTAQELKHYKFGIFKISQDVINAWVTLSNTGTYTHHE